MANDLRKIDPHTALVLDGKGRELGKVLTCATDTAIGRHDGKIYSVASPDKPAGLKITCLSAGFIRISESLPAGTVVELKGARRSIKATIESDVRPDRTARKALKSFL